MSDPEKIISKYLKSCIDNVEKSIDDISIAIEEAEVNAIDTFDLEDIPEELDAIVLTIREFIESNL
jgi:hypothetical protein